MNNESLAMSVGGMADFSYLFATYCARRIALFQRIVVYFNG